MTEAIVIKAFKCKVSKIIYRPGDTYQSNPERIKFLQDAGYLTPAPANKNDVANSVENPENQIDAVTAEPEIAKAKSRTRKK